MSKKGLFSLVFVIISLGICLLIANEYLKRIEIKAINSYFTSLKQELGEKNLSLDFSQTQCSGFFKHSCKISDITLGNIRFDSPSIDSPNIALESQSIAQNLPPSWQNSQITFSDTSLAITKLNTTNIAVSVNIGEISQSLIFLPKNFAYLVSFTKQDSALGYVMLDRMLKLDIGNIAVSVNFAVLIREKRFRNKSILFLLKEWFDPTTPSFYEYSLEKLDISLKAKDAINSEFYEANSENLRYLQDNLNITNKHFESLANAIISLMKNEISEIDFSVRRKNADLVFFNTLTDTATTKKALEIKEILDSINDSYNITMQTK